MVLKNQLKSAEILKIQKTNFNWNTIFSWNSIFSKNIDLRILSAKMPISAKITISAEKILSAKTLISAHKNRLIMVLKNQLKSAEILKIKKMPEISWFALFYRLLKLKAPTCPVTLWTRTFEWCTCCCCCCTSLHLLAPPTTWFWLRIAA